MPIITVDMVPGGHLQSAHIKQYADLLTGLMTDQPVTISNDVSITGPLQQVQLVTPPVPPAGQMKIYPKADGKFYSLDSTGLEVPLGAGEGAEEVWFGPDPPDPRGDYEIWIDTDAPEITPPDGTPGFVTYVHTQLMPEAVWTVEHGLHCYPSVTVVDTGGTVIIPSVEYEDDTMLVATFGSPTSGKAYLN